MKLYRCVVSQVSTCHLFSLCACHMQFAVFQAGNEIAHTMEHTSYDIVSGLPEIDAYMERLQGLFYKLDQFLQEIKHPILSNAIY